MVGFHAEVTLSHEFGSYSPIITPSGERTAATCHISSTSRQLAHF